MHQALHPTKAPTWWNVIFVAIVTIVSMTYDLPLTLAPLSSEQTYQNNTTYDNKLIKNKLIEDDIIHNNESIKDTLSGDQLTSGQSGLALSYPVVPVVSSDQQSSLLNQVLPRFDASKKNLYEVWYAQRCHSEKILCSMITFEGPEDQTQAKYWSLLLGLQTQALVASTYYDSKFPRLIIKPSAHAQRAYTNAQSIVIHIANLDAKQAIQVLTHEFGHYMDLGLVQGDSKTLDSTFTRHGKDSFAIDDPSLTYYRISWLSEKQQLPGTKTEDFCTNYGAQNIFEDFAECFNLYINHQNYFVAIAQTSDQLQKKYNYFYRLIRGDFVTISDSKPYNKISDRYRDSTIIQAHEES